MLLDQKFSQGKCQACHSWHFAVELDNNKNIIGLKCCKCKRVIKATGQLIIL